MVPEVSCGRIDASYIQYRVFRQESAILYAVVGDTFIEAASSTVKMRVKVVKNMFKKRLNWFCFIVSDYLARTERLIPVENFKTEIDCIWSLYYYLPTRPILIQLYMNSLNLLFF